MPRRRHDALSKDLLALWYEPLGPVTASRRVQGEERQIDLVVNARAQGKRVEARRRRLGVLGAMAQGLTAYEIFRNPCTGNEVRDCVIKSLELDAESRRRARRRGATPAVAERPHLWAITPSFSPALRAEFGAYARAGLPVGFFSLARGLYTTVVSVALLPEVPETLWLRLLGRGAVQARAFIELSKLPKGHPLHAPTARRVLRWLREAERDPHMTAAERELKMNSEQWVLQWERRMIRKGEVKGEAKGLRTAVADLCEVLGVSLTPMRRARLATMGINELEALREGLKQTRRWPSLRAAPARVASPRAPSRTKRSALARFRGWPRPASYRPAEPPALPSLGVVANQRGSQSAPGALVRRVWPLPSARMT